MLTNLDDIIHRLHTESNLIKVIREIECMHTPQCNSYENVDIVVPNIENIRFQYAALLYESEVSAAKKINSWKDIKKFYKWSVYALRCLFELTCYQHLSMSQLKHILFVGAGAVPVSAIIASIKGYKTTVIERDDKAINLSKRICSRLGIAINFIHEDLYNYSKYYPYNLIVVSGTVGITTAEKQKIGKHIIGYCGNSTILCFRNPVREEKIIMAPLNPKGIFRYSEYYFRKL